MVALPNWLVSGRMLTVRLEPLPLKEKLALETNPGFEELAVTIRLVADVSKSPTVKACGPVMVSSLMPRAAMDEIVGGELTLVAIITELLVEFTSVVVVDTLALLVIK